MKAAQEERARRDQMIEEAKAARQKIEREVVREREIVREKEKERDRER